MSNTSILDRIEATLGSLASDPEVKMEGVWYGACQETKLTKWNYFIFNRLKTTKNNNGTRTDLQTLYEVHIIHEGHIPEGYVARVISELQTMDPEYPGAKLKLTNDDIPYAYTFKQNTNMVVEIATITFYHPEKRC